MDFPRLFYWQLARSLRLVDVRIAVDARPSAARFALGTGICEFHKAWASFCR